MDYNKSVLIVKMRGAWWHMPVIPTLMGLRQEDCEFEASLLKKTKKSKMRFFFGEFIYLSQ
jgi:hypothetical protein